MLMTPPCTALPANSLQRFLDHLNSVKPSIRFTVEVESDSKLPFLDVLLQHDPDGSISMTAYWKPMHMNRYLDIAFHHHLAHKIVVVRTLQQQGRSHHLLSTRQG